MLDERLLDLLCAAVAVGVRARRAQDGAAERKDVLHVGQPERLDQALHRAPPPLPESNDLMAVDFDPLADHRPDHRIKSGAIPAPGKHTDTHLTSPARP